MENGQNIISIFISYTVKTVVKGSVYICNKVIFVSWRRQFFKLVKQVFHFLSGYTRFRMAKFIKAIHCLIMMIIKEEIFNFLP